jgi:arylsulfatase A-like enzyme
MTGKHTGHTRIRGNRHPQIPLRPEDTTVAEVLKGAGYRTAIYGKWGLAEACTTGVPNKKGFDDWFGYLNQQHAHNYYTDVLWQNENEFFLRGNFGGMKKQYAPDLFTEHAVEFIRKKSSRPFFLYLADIIPHADGELGRATGNGMEVPSDAPYSAKDWPQAEKNFAAMVTRMDSHVGSVLAALRESGQEENTLVIFTSDNGPHSEGGHKPTFFDSNGPLRGIKRDLYEGGIREPTIARWPGQIPAGAVSDQVWAFWDFLPTAAELAGVPAPPSIDGISMVDALRGKPQKNHEYLYWEFHERGFHQAVRMGDWKAVRTGGAAGTMELYDLHQDTGERNNVAGSHPDIVNRIAAIMKTAHTKSDYWPVKGE